MNVTHQISVHAFCLLQTKPHITILVKGLTYRKRHYQNQIQNQVIFKCVRIFAHALSIIRGLTEGSVHIKL